MTLNPAYKEWMLSKGENQVDTADALPVAAAIPLNTDPVIPNRTTLTKGRSKRVLMPQPSSKQLSPIEARELKNQGYTNGLIKSIARSNMEFPLRIWIVDNSGSMMKGDGHRLIVPQNNMRKDV